jgi:hypothetical protein
MVNPAMRSKIAAEYGKLPLAFELNQGQADARVKFLSRGPGYTLFLTQTAVVFQLASRRTSQAVPESSQSGAAGAPFAAASAPRVHESPLRIFLEGANPQSAIQALNQLPGKTNYLIGTDPRKWTTNVPNFGAVEYRGVYPGVTSVFHGNAGALEWDFRLRPGANPDNIVLHIAGAKYLRIAANGDAVLNVADDAAVTLRRPAVYQTVGGSRQKVTCKFALHGPDELSFALGPYDRSHPLIIDPAVVYSTYLGPISNVVSGPVEVAVDSAGNAYLAGTVDNANVKTGPDYPTTGGAFEPTTKDSRTAFVTKLNATGSALVYSTFLSGMIGGGTSASALAIDSLGDAYVAGYVYDSDFPTTSNAFEQACVGSDQNGICTLQSFLTKLSSDGSSLLYSTYLGATTATVAINALAVDSVGSAYVAGVTLASDLPVKPNPGAYLASCNLNTFTGNTCAEQYGFVAKFDPSSSGANSLVYSTYLGGTITGMQIAVDSTGNAYLGGYVELTSDTTFPITTRFVPISGGGFITKLNAAGTNIVYSDLVGAAGGSGLAVDSTGAAYVLGTAPLPGGAQLTPSADIAVSKLDPTGTTVVFSDGFGGSGGDDPLGLSVDGNGDAFVVGYTASTDFPTTAGAPQTAFTGFSDAFLTGLEPDGSAILFSTYLGGSSDTWGTAIALDASGDAYLVGWTESTDFPTSSGAFLTGCLGIGLNTQDCHDAYVTKFSSVAPPAPKAYATFSPTSIDFGSVPVGQTTTQQVTLSNTGASPLVLQVVAPESSNFPFNYDISGTNTNECNGVAVSQPILTQPPVTINAGSSCTFTLQFTPGSGGPASGQMVFQDDTDQSNLPATAVGGGEFQQFLPLSGTGEQPDFSISASPASPSPVTVTAGNSGYATIYVSPVDGFTDTVNLKASGAPTGVTPSFYPSSITGGSGRSTLTLATASTTTAGTYTITVTGTDASGQPSHTATVTLMVNTSSNGGGGSSGGGNTGNGGTANQLVLAASPNLPTQFAAIDFTNPATPTVVNPIPPGINGGLVITCGGGETLAAVGNQASGQVVIYDVSDPASPQVLGSINTQLNAIGAIKLNGNRVLVGDANGSQVVLIDISTPRTPEILSTYTTPIQGIGSAALSGSYAVVAGPNNPQIDIIDYTDPANPTDKQFNPQFTSGLSVNLDGTTAVVGALFSTQIALVDITGPSLLGTASTGLTYLSKKPKLSLSIKGSQVAAATSSDPRVALIDFTNPSSPAVSDFDPGLGLLTGWKVNLGSKLLAIGSIDASTVALYSLSGNSATLLGSTNSGISSISSVCNADFNTVTSNTPVGNQVKVQPVDASSGTSPVTITFAGVSQTGQTSLSITTSGPTPPANFKLGNPPIYYDLSTTASYTAPVKICISYSGSYTPPPALWHYDSTQTPPAWVNITTGNQSNNGQICGWVSPYPSFSPFAIFSSTVPVDTTAALTSTLNPSVAGQSVTFDAQVTSSVVGTPTGSVSFIDGTTTLGSATLDTSGMASFSTSGLAAGSHSITAQYSGDTYFAGSTSGALVETVAAPAVKIALSGAPSIVADSSGYTVSVLITNEGNVPLDLVQEVSARLATATPSSVPASSISGLAPGSTGTLTLVFPASAGASGAIVPLSVSGSYSGGSLAGNWSVGLRGVTLP